MKVFYVAQFQRGYERCVVWALRHLGVTVDTYPWDHSHKVLLKDLLREKPDFVLFSKPQPLNCKELLDCCTSLGITTVAWVWDLYWGYRGKQPQQFYADILLTTDGGHQREFDRRGYNHAVLRQGIHEPDHVFYAPEPAHDVAFVGGTGRGYYAGRNDLVDWLRKTYEGRFIHHTNTKGLSLNEKLAKVKVVVGDSYPSPNYWSNRVYEITGRGGFLLHPSTKGLNDEFTDSRHYIEYSRGNFGHLKQLIDHWVREDDHREVIRRCGFDHCGERYTYTRRVSELLKIVENYFKI